MGNLYQFSFPHKLRLPIYIWGIKRSDLFVGRANDVKRFAVQ